MSSSDSGLLSLVNASGFLFQLRVEQEIIATQAKHGKAVLAREYPWLHTTTQHAGFIDLITSAGTNGKIVFECKRVKAAEWVFLVPPQSKPTTSVRVLWTRRFSDTHQGAAWDSFSLKCQSLKSQFCVVRGQADAQQPMLERIATILLVSVEALADEELALNHPVGWSGLRFYFPAIVTTAVLQACHVDPSDIDLSTGELGTATFEEVPYIRFTKSMSTSLKSSKLPSTLQESVPEGDRTVFVVSATHLEQFLSEPWEFNPPVHGAPWPWDLPIWQNAA